MNAACGIEPSVGTVDHENARAEGLYRRSSTGQGVLDPAIGDGRSG